MKVLSFVLLLIISCLATKIKIDDQDDSVVTISNGPIQGVVYNDHRAFRSIPYAQPPIGNLRWASPEPASSWSPQTLNATVFGAGCPQNCELPPHTCPEVQSEDCLTLNVYTPLPTSSTPLPVMVFLPGGRFEQGTAACTLYDGGFFVAQSGVILVTVSYRLGVLGWLVTGNLTGNYGLQDQRLALQWVQNNIAAFGGDPKQVTLFGQSAGASSTAMHLISAKSAGLFQQAIMESIPMPLPMKPTDIAQELGEIFTSDLGCSQGDVNCMRGKSIDDILASQKESQKYVYPTRPLDLFLPWTPCVDGVDIVDEPLVAFAAGNFHKVPIMTGTVLNDAYLFVYQAANGTRINVAEYMAVLGYVFLDEALAVAQRYPPDPFANDTRTLLSVLGTDYIFYCSNRNAATSIASYSVPFYSYRFNHILSFDPWGQMYDFCIDKVCHGAELPILFHSAAPYYKFTPQEEQLSIDMITYWTNFAKFGSPNDPNNKNLPVWPQYSPYTDQVMVFEDSPVVFSGILEPTCEFWDSLGYSWGT